MPKEKIEPRFLRNIGQPSKIFVKYQRFFEYTNQKGQRKKIEIVFHRVNEDNIEADRLRLVVEEEKAIIHSDYENGGWKYKSRKIHPIDFEFTVFNYPHVLQYPVGKHKFDIVYYTIMVGDLIEIHNHEHVDVLKETFGFLEETNKAGEPIEVSQFRAQTENPPEPIDKSLFPKQFGDAGEGKVNVPHPERIALEKHESDKADEFYQV